MIGDDDFCRKVDDFIERMMLALQEVDLKDEDGIALTVAVTAITMYYEWIINTSPMPQAARVKMLKEAKDEARKACQAYIKRLHPDKSSN